MKKLLATTAVALVSFAGHASAQSVLERVLSEIDNSTNLAAVNGTFANIAENIGGTVGSGGTASYTDPDGNPISLAEYADMVSTAKDIAASWISIVSGVYVFSEDGSEFATEAEALAYVDNFVDLLAATYVTAVPGGSGGTVGSIDGSIANVVDGISEATQVAIANAGVSATEWDMPTMNFGDMATTVLGAVNTGEITLGVNQAVDEAKTTSTGALSLLVDQIGGSADSGAIVLNVASNMTGVNGSIRNSMTEVNGSVGDAATTVLGAVNTGTIVSGVNAAVSGIVSTGASQL